jgi:hypothetical protein
MDKQAEKVNYNWKRFWCPREGKINLNDDGFLYDPESKNIYYIQQDAQSFEKYAQVPCIILLGEPGIGKSTEIINAYEITKGLVDNHEKQTLYKNLNAYSDITSLLKDVFESEEINLCKKQNIPFYLFLDSLDECRFRIDTISQILYQQIEKLYYDNFFLRIACRTAEWPGSLEEGLTKIWGKERLVFIELVPLRKKDVEIACITRHFHYNNFLTQILEREVQPLAIKPITLNFLLDIFGREPNLPNTRLELFDQGIRLLIEEHNPSRKESKIIGQFPVAQKINVAERIAAIMILCNINVITQDNYSDNEMGLTKEEIIDSDDSNFRVIESVIESGLFSSRGKNRMGWAHQSYAEFLAARFLINNIFSEEQLFNFILDSVFGERKIIPPLNETVAWLVDMKPDLFKHLVKNNVEVMLKSGLILQDNNDKALLVRHLLTKFAQQKLFDLKYSFNNYYKKLTHPNLSKQLRPFIIDKKKSWYVRTAAILIARECDQVELLDDLVKIFCDSNDSLEIRIDIGWCLYHIADEPSLLKMKKVLDTDLKEDEDDELKNVCLFALWPKHLATLELFSFLQRPKNTNYIGGFYHLSDKIIEEKILLQDLPIALNWMGTLGTRHGSGLYHYEGLMDYIMYEGWKNLENPEILHSYVGAIKRLRRNYDELIIKKNKLEFEAELQQEDTKRRLLIESIVNSLTDYVNGIELFLGHNFQLVFTKDFSWLLNQAHKEKDEKKSRAWATLANWHFDINNTTNSEHLLGITEKNEIIKNEFSTWLIPIELGSEKAKKDKNRYMKFYKPRIHNDKRPLRKLDWEERVFHKLLELEKGNSDAYWQLLYLIQFDPEKENNNSDDYAYDIQTLPGWRHLDIDQQQLVIDSSKTYLVEADPYDDKWLGQKIVYKSSRAGYRAICLLYKRDEVFVNTLDERIWKKWAASVIDYPSYTNTENKSFQKRIIELTYKKAPNESLNVLKVLLDEECDEDDVYILNNFEDCWDENISQIVYYKLKSGETKVKVFSTLLRYLFKYNYKPAEDYFFCFISKPLPTDPDLLQKIVLGCSLLIVYRTRDFWKPIWQLIKKYPDEVGKKLIIKLPYTREEKINYLDELKEQELADLVVWITKNFADSANTRRWGIQEVTPEKEVMRFRDSIIEHLKLRGQKEAHKAIEFLKKQLPEIEWLSRVEYESKIVTRIKSWQPTSVKEFKQLVANNKSRYIQTDDDLLRTVLESLERLQKELHGETPAVKFLWNSKPENVTPKEETELSNFIKRHLKKDLQNVFVNREVEIRGRRGKVQGEKPDIIVEAVKYDSYKKPIERLSLIIEVKCCFNKEYLTAMKTQLADRYLNNNQTKYGIYIGGWYMCDGWDFKDPRLKRSVGRNKTLREIEKYFADQAKELSQNGLVVKSFVMDCRLV